MKTKLIVGIALTMAVCGAQAQPVPGGNAQNPPTDDWGAFALAEKQLKGAEPQAVIDGYRKLFESRPQWLPLLGIKISMNIADAYKKLGDNAKVLEIDDWCIKKYNADAAVVWPIWHKASTLNAQKKYDEVGRTVDENWEAIVRCGQSGEEWLTMYAATTLREAADAYNAAGQPDKIVPLLQKGMAALPAMWDDKEQGQGDWRDGWAYNTLVARLTKSGKNDEALQWAKLHFAIGSFDKDVLARANTSLGRVWGELEEYQKIRVFAQMQDGTADAGTKNPLADTKLPVFEEKQLKEHLARLQPILQIQAPAALPRYKTKELIGVLIVTGDYGGAMNLARRLMKDDPTKPDGALQICRIFKAADLSTRRANQYLLFLEGKAENPIVAFMKEYPAKTEAK